jgi:hypothetical protein
MGLNASQLRNAIAIDRMKRPLEWNGLIGLILAGIAAAALVVFGSGA